MPFQISYSQRPRLVSQVTLVTAGEDQIHICTPTMYLEGIVIGDMSGHTIEWEQIGGTAVTLINGNTLTPQFDEVDSTDKVFRLYIDRYTGFEQFDDVVILKTPTSFAGCSFTTDQQTITFELDPQPVDCGDITAFVSVTVPPPSSLEGEDPAGASIVVEVSWAHPILNTRFVPYIEQYRVVEDTLVVDNVPNSPIPTAGEGGGPPSDTLQYDGTFAEYRIDTYYNIAGIKIVKESCTQDFSTLPQPLVKAYNDAVRGVSFTPVQSSLTTTYFTNIAIQEEDMAAVAFMGTESHLDRVNFSFINISEGVDPAIVTFSSTTSSINITRFGGTGIGGGP